MWNKIKSALEVTSKQIDVIDRKTGEKFKETIYGENAMKLIYGNPIGLKVVSKLLTNQKLSDIYGAYNDSTMSKGKIQKFVEFLNIDTKECKLPISGYQSFNDFFARKLKPDARPIDTQANTVISPGDGRLLVFPKISKTQVSYVKWAPIKLNDLFDGDHKLEKKYAHGSCVVLRLCPSDYHRVHFPVDGTPSVTKNIPGLLHSVNPYALEQKIPVFCINKRTMCTLTSEKFGDVLLMEIGAMFVGSIVQTYRPTSTVKKGDEKCFFKFGGSSTILFFEQNKVSFDNDLIHNSENKIETYVRMGERIGVAEGTRTPE
jgi:phosphatidylserine decarboxylase